MHLLAHQRAGFIETPLGGVPLALPAEVGPSIVVPVGAGATLRLARITNSQEREIIPVAGGGGVEPLAAPVINPDSGFCFWVGAAGYLVYEEGLEGATAVWRPWPPNVQGLPFLRPFRAPNGRFWAFCAEGAPGTPPGQALACVMTVSGGGEKKTLLGPYLSAGSQAFRGRSRYGEPWRDAVEEINLGFDFEGRWLLPVMRLGGGQTVVAMVADGPAASGSVREFIFREGRSTPRDATLALHSDSGGLRTLAHAFRISSTDELEVFLDGDKLCILHLESNECASWQLSSSR